MASGVGFLLLCGGTYFSDDRGTLASLGVSLLASDEEVLVLPVLLAGFVYWLYPRSDMNAMSVDSTKGWALI